MIKNRHTKELQLSLNCCYEQRVKNKRKIGSQHNVEENCKSLEELITVKQLQM